MLTTSENVHNQWKCSQLVKMLTTSENAHNRWKCSQLLKMFMVSKSLSTPMPIKLTSPRRDVECNASIVTSSPAYAMHSKSIKHVRSMHSIHTIVYRYSANQSLKCLTDLAWPNYIIYHGIVSISELKSLQYYLTTVLTIIALMMKMDPNPKALQTNSVFGQTTIFWNLCP